jgi:hypothetical protein
VPIIIELFVQLNWKYSISRDYMGTFSVLWHPCYKIQFVAHTEREAGAFIHTKYGNRNNVPTGDPHNK